METSFLNPKVNYTHWSQTSTVAKDLAATTEATASTCWKKLVTEGIRLKEGQAVVKKTMTR
jgi:hypothetical protein